MRNICALSRINCAFSNEKFGVASSKNSASHSGTASYAHWIESGTPHAMYFAMTTPARVTDYLKRLSELERGKGPLATALCESEKALEVTRLRSILPAFILGHHDRKIQQGKASIVPVVHGICSACHLRLPIGHLARLQSSQDLEVCDNCGTFIFTEATNESPPQKNFTRQSRNRKRSLSADERR